MYLNKYEDWMFNLYRFDFTTSFNVSLDMVYNAYILSVVI